MDSGRPAVYTKHVDAALRSALRVEFRCRGEANTTAPLEGFTRGPRPLVAVVGPLLARTLTVQSNDRSGPLHRGPGNGRGTRLDGGSVAAIMEGAPPVADGVSSHPWAVTAPSLWTAGRPSGGSPPRVTPTSPAQAAGRRIPSRRPPRFSADGIAGGFKRISLHRSPPGMSGFTPGSSGRPSRWGRHDPVSPTKSPGKLDRSGPVGVRLPQKQPGVGHGRVQGVSQWRYARGVAHPDVDPGRRVAAHGLFAGPEQAGGLAGADPSAGLGCRGGAHGATNLLSVGGTRARGGAAPTARHDRVGSRHWRPACQRPLGSTGEDPSRGVFSVLG